MNKKIVILNGSRMERFLITLMIFYRGAIGAGSVIAKVRLLVGADMNYICPLQMEAYL